MPAVILTKFEPMAPTKPQVPFDHLQEMLTEVMGHPIIPPDIILLALTPLGPNEMRHLDLSQMARKVVALIHTRGVIYSPVLQRLWELDPKRCIAKDDIKLIECMFANPENVETAHGLLVHYAGRFECPMGVLKMALARCPKCLSLSIPLAVTQGDLHEQRAALKTLIQRATGKEFHAAVRLATKLEFRIDEQRLIGAVSKDWPQYALPVLKYYEVMNPEGIVPLLEKWLLWYLQSPETYDISPVMLEAMQAHMKKSLALQGKLVRILLFVPMLAATKAAWSRAVNRELLGEGATEPFLRGLIAVLQRTTKPEHQGRLPSFPLGDEDAALSSFLKLCLGDKELKVKMMPPPTAEEEASYRERYTGRTEVEVAMRQVTYTRFFSCGAVRAHLMGRRGMVFINNMPAADNVVIDVKKAVLEVIVDIANTRKELVELPIDPITPELTALIKAFMKHNRSNPLSSTFSGNSSGLVHAKLDAKLHHQMLQKEVVLTRAWSAKWNYLVVHHPQLFSLSTRKLWLRAMLGPERYLQGDMMPRKRFHLERDRILEKGLKMFREEGDAYLIIDVEFIGECGVVVAGMDHPAAISAGVRNSVTQEFFSLYSSKLITALLNNNGNDGNDGNDGTAVKTNAKKMKVEWRDLGIVIAQAVLDGRALDLRRIEGLLHGIETMREYKQSVQDGIRQGIRRISPIWPFDLHELPRLLMTEEPRIVLEPSHGYTRESKSIVWLQRFLDTERQHLPLFLEFCTGTPVSLEPLVRINVVPNSGATAPGHTRELPLVMTCGACLRLPRYASFEVLRERMLYAIREGREIFLLQIPNLPF